MMHTRVLSVRDGEGLGRWVPDQQGTGVPDLERWEVGDCDCDDNNNSSSSSSSEAMVALREAGAYLRTSDVPVAFPTETVYGLGADATRSAAVKGIYAAKGRPADNPLIVHVCDLAMLRGLLVAAGPCDESAATATATATTTTSDEAATIPPIYLPLIRRFWPGPLTILLPNPQPSRLAPEVTAGLPTFGCRMPASALARSLIRLAGAPLAAPSANASTRPSPTAARHVLDDLAGRIELVLDGGPCAVGVESTVVDGLCDPPAVLRPGGVSVAQLRACGGGWERVQKAYRDASEGGDDKDGKDGKTLLAPRAPGMKYKHYSPRAKVVLYEAGKGTGLGLVSDADVRAALAAANAVQEAGEPTKKRVTVGMIRTQRWPAAAGLECSKLTSTRLVADEAEEGGEAVVAQFTYEFQEGVLLDVDARSPVAALLDINLGPDVKTVAQGLFSALRELDRRGADVIFVEGVSDGDGIAAAVMNRLRKAASEIKA